MTTLKDLFTHICRHRATIDCLYKRLGCIRSASHPASQAISKDWATINEVTFKVATRNACLCVRMYDPRARRSACSVVFSQACLCSINVDMYVVKRRNTIYHICYIDREHKGSSTDWPFHERTHALTYTHTCIRVLHDSQLLVHSLSSFMYRRYLHSRTIYVWVFIFHHVCICIFCIYNRLAFRTPETETFQVVVPLLFRLFKFFCAWFI